MLGGLQGRFLDIRQEQTQLHETIRRNGIESREIYQVSRRMKNLLPDSLSSLKREHRHGNSAARAERLASTDKEYLRLIEEYVDLYSKGLEARVQFETHRMLLSARQSMFFPQLSYPTQRQPKLARL